MVGREVLFQMEKKAQSPGNVILKVEDVYADNDKGLQALKGVSFQVSTGEILGLAGVAGNGQGELAQVITGLRQCTKGKIIFNNENITNRPALTAIQSGMAYIPEDRTHVGTAPNLSITDNVIMKKYRKPPISHGWVVDGKAATQYANQLKEEYDIIVPDVDTPVRLLSGGNLQRVILARELSGQPPFMVAVQPTRGLDVGAIEGVHRLLLDQREAGAAVLLISEELEELLSLSDRILVIYEGRIMGEITGEFESQGLIETIGMMMTGTPIEKINLGVS
jgi:ABC-type uncharacterized transport system ATPase subunit